MKVAIISLGCKVNSCESESIAASLKAKGHEVLMGFGQADAYIINTCAVTQEAEKKSRQCVARVRKYNPQAKIYIIGCASQKNASQFSDKKPDFVGGNFDKEGVCCFPCGVLEKEPSDTFETMTYSENTRTRAFVKIQDGCNNFCSYCIVPYLRGRSRSRSIDDIICECNLKALDTSEIVLTGVNISAFGKDTGTSLVELINHLACVRSRFRIGSLEAGVIDRPLLSAMKSAGNFCPHFHLSLQSGDNTVLQSMNRKYTREEYMDKCKLIRKYFPNAAITTDIIVGFPTETDDAFKNSLLLAETVGFADIHVFPYSRRSGTKAYSLKLIPQDVIERRESELIELKRKLKKEYSQSVIGEKLEVVAEFVQGGYAEGYSRNYVRVYFAVNGEAALGKLYTVKACELYQDGVKGEVCY